MTKLAIISSYSESCGNAAFTRVLHDSIEEYTNIEVDVIELNLGLLQSINPSARSKANEHIKEICGKLVKYDLVNIQLEPGLYGTLPKDIINRTKWLMSANKNTSVTLHSPRIMPSTHSGSRAGIKKLLQFKIASGIKDIFSGLISNIHIKINKSIIKNAVVLNCKLIVHTLRAKNQIKYFYNYDNVKTHPLKIVPEDYQQNKSTLNNLRQQLDLQEDDILIGIFGYISAYKGHTDALYALKNLPSNYKLLIFGRQHPQTISTSGEIDKYITKLISIIQNDHEINNRVFFMGELNDKEFLDVAGSIDVAWLPYYENGQDGSGIASICLDISPRVLCSASFAFDELFKLTSYMNHMRFDIGNHLELSEKTKMIMRKPIPEKPYDISSTFTIKTQALSYTENL
jgi:glycosyltransferase involved in cell wall biosynthesis